MAELVLLSNATGGDAVGPWIPVPGPGFHASGRCDVHVKGTWVSDSIVQIQVSLDGVTTWTAEKPDTNTATYTITSAAPEGLIVVDERYPFIRGRAATGGSTGIYAVAIY